MGAFGTNDVAAVKDVQQKQAEQGNQQMEWDGNKTLRSENKWPLPLCCLRLINVASPRGHLGYITTLTLPFTVP
jgi:hypothetical protein